MGSPFATRLAAVGAPLGTRHNGEFITLSNADDGSATVKAIVEIDDVNSAGSDGFIVINGRLLIETAIVARKVAALGTVLTAVVRSEQWHVYEQSGDRDGWTHFSIYRKFQDAKHSNLYDLHGNQIPYAD
jgi:hypothetical protein